MGGVLRATCGKLSRGEPRCSAPAARRALQVEAASR